MKSTLEHLRSFLEYCAQDLADNVLGISNDKIYFPYGKNEQDFKSRLGSNLKGLTGTYLSIIVRIQPYKCGDNWLIHLCKFTNYNKHKALQEQSRKNLGQSTTKVGNIIRSSGGGSINIGRLIVNGKLLNPTGPLEINDQRKVKDIEKDLQNFIKVERVHEDVSFIDSKTGIDLLDLIHKSKSEISKLIEDLKCEFEADK